MYSYTHVLIYSCTHVLMYSYTHVPMYSCTHELMYSCTPLSVEPDLCKVVLSARPADQRAVRWYWTGFDTRQIVSNVNGVTGGPLLRTPRSTLRKPFLSEGSSCSLTCCRMFWAPWRRLYVISLPGDKQEDHQSVRLTRSMTRRTSCCLTLYCWCCNVFCFYASLSSPLSFPSLDLIYDHF